jgi:hypothetical protein
VFCPEDGGPYVEKPRFFGSLESYRSQLRLDGYVLLSGTKTVTLFGRFSGNEYEVTVDEAAHEAVFSTANADVVIDWNSQAVKDASLTGSVDVERVDMRLYLTMAAVLKGLRASGRVHFVNCDINHQ